MGEETLAHLALGLEAEMAGEGPDSGHGIKPDEGLQQDPAVDAHNRDAEDTRSRNLPVRPFGGGAGAGDDLPRSGVR